ncbi:MAG: serine/threonine-protein kinase [Planctomycetia bacterium]|nr:serine/threonine-protein kinase [Planctomycetia bacterium]
MAYTTLGSYQFQKCVCVGSMTQIWQGYSTQLNIPVAIKMPTEERKQDKKALSALRWEYQIGREIHHPRIVEMYDFLNEDGQVMLVMEWLPYRSLSDVMSEGTETHAWRIPQIALDLVEAVAFFNSLGWVHRDLSPEVFMIQDETNEAKLIEFPYARHPRKLWTRIVGAGELPQRGRYLSPELIRGDVVDQRTDVYSLACILFELTTGVPPYSGENFNQLVHQHLNVPTPTADALNEQLTPEFSKLLRQCMDKMPTERPSTTHEMFQKLKEMKIFKRTPVKGK